MPFASIDMWTPYCLAIRKMVPHAKIVVYRFHVMKHLNQRISQMRRKVQKEANDDIKAILKGDRFIPVRNRSDPSTKEVNHQSDRGIPHVPEWYVRNL